MEFRHCGHAAIEKALELIGTHLSRKIDGPGLRERHKAVMPCNERRRRKIIHGMEFHRRVLINKIIEPPGSERKARHDTPRVNAFPLAINNPGLNEIQDLRRYHGRMDAKVLAIAQMFQGLIGDAANIDVQGHSILYELSDVAGNILDLFPYGRVDILNQR